MDSHTVEAHQTHIRHDSSNFSLNTLRAFTGNPSSSAPHPFPMMHPHARTGSHVADVKPRLTKEQHDILENHFRSQAKPSTNIKKGFAETLNVPLDKINNWFQNRRAKVKQEAKKAQNQEALMQQNAQNYAMQQQQSQSQIQQPTQLGNQPPQQMPIPHQSSYFPNNTGMGQNMHNTDSSQSGLGGLNAQFNLAQSDFSTPGLTSISEATMGGSVNDVLQSLNAAGYQLPMDPQQNAFNGFESGSYGSNMSGHGNNQFLSSLNIPSTTFGDLNFSNFTTVAGMQSADSPNSFMGNPFAPQSGSGFHTNASVTSLPLFDDDSDAQDEMFNPNFKFHPPQGFSHRQTASTSQVSLPIFGGQPFENHGLYQQSNHSSQVIVSAPDDNFAFADLEPPNPPFAQDAFSRRSSSTSNLADTMQGVGIESRSPSESGSFKQSLQGSSIAARRQRRPAPLGSSATRSASYTPGMPGSPNASTTSLNAEQNLRRIRSSQGMNGGRVQKNSSGSAQHSPVTLAFGQAASSPKFARQAAGLVSGVSTPGGNGGTIPPTPLTPSENPRFPSWQTSGEIKPQPSLVDTSSPPDSLGLTYSTTESTTSEHQDVKGASPKTPAEASLPLNQMGSITSNSTYRDTPPQSAPATQQTFSQPMFIPQNQQPVNDFLVPNDFMLSQMRRPSLPDNSGNASFDNQVQQYGLQGFNPTAGDLQMGYPMQYSNANSYSPVMFSLESTSSMSSAAGPSQAATSSFADNLVVHEYAPPNSSGGKSESRRHADHPKAFVFANHGPNDFKSTS